MACFLVSELVPMLQQIAMDSGSTPSWNLSRSSVPSPEFVRFCKCIKTTDVSKQVALLGLFHLSLAIEKCSRLSGKCMAHCRSHVDVGK